MDLGVKKYYGRKKLAIIRILSCACQKSKKEHKREKDRYCSKHIADRWFGRRIEKHNAWFVEAEK